MPVQLLSPTKDLSDYSASATGLREQHAQSLLTRRSREGAVASCTIDVSGLGAYSQTEHSAAGLPCRKELQKTPTWVTSARY